MSALPLQSYNKPVMTTIEQKQKLFKAKVAIALYDVLGRIPKDEELHQIVLLARRLCKVVPGLH